MSYFKEGQKVMILPDLRTERYFSRGNDEAHDIVASDMLKFAGRVVTIEKSYQASTGIKYKLKEDEAHFHWTSGMLLPLNEALIKEEYQKGTLTQEEAIIAISNVEEEKDDIFDILFAHEEDTSESEELEF